MEIIRLFFEIVGMITTTAMIFGGIALFFGWFLGVFLVMKRLGLGRWYRKILIISTNDGGQTLKKDLVDSGVFREKNVTIANDNSLADIKDSDLILYDYWKLPGCIDEVLRNKQKRAGLIVYSPANNQRMSADVVEMVNKEPFTVLVNMRGRLVNDILITLMSTSYDKKRSK